MIIISLIVAIFIIFIVVLVFIPYWGSSSVRSIRTRLAELEAENLQIRQSPNADSDRSKQRLKSNNEEIARLRRLLEDSNLKCM